MKTKTEVKHTPGPWKIKPQAQRGSLGLPPFIKAENPLPGHGSTVAAMGGGSIHYANWESNAFLIAAAPDLLETAKEMLALHEEVAELDYYKDGIAQLRAAIARAEGHNE